MLDQLGLSYMVHQTLGPGDAARLACSLIYEPSVTSLAVVGGDGTFSEVAGVAAGTHMPVALIPAGTGNAMARAIGARSDGDWIRALWSRPLTRTMDMGTANGRPFAAVAGLGFDAELVKALRRTALLPRLAGWVATGVTQIRKLRAFEIEGSGRGEGPEALELASGPALCLAICNSPYYGAGIPMAPQAVMSDGLLDFCLLREVPVVDLPLLAVALAQGRHSQHPAVAMWRGRSMQLRTDPPVPWHVDGEHGGVTPVTVEIRPSCLEVLLPAPP